jgi:hypothetical protein
LNKSTFASAPVILYFQIEVFILEMLTAVFEILKRGPGKSDSWETWVTKAKMLVITVPMFVKPLKIQSECQFYLYFLSNPSRGRIEKYHYNSSFNTCYNIQVPILTLKKYINFKGIKYMLLLV